MVLVLFFLNCSPFEPSFNTSDITDRHFACQSQQMKYTLSLSANEHLQKVSIENYINTLDVPARIVFIKNYQLIDLLLNNHMLKSFYDMPHQAAASFLTA